MKSKVFSKFSFFLILLLFSLHAVYTESGIIKYFQKGIKYEYRIKLLELALLKTQEEGILKLIPISEDVTQARGLNMLSESTVDVAFLGTNIEREKNYLGVKIDIMRGILGYRVFLILDKNIKLFEPIKNILQLSKLRAGFGQQWADYEILKANNLSLLGVANTDLLIPMLDAGRFEYYPRGINEAWEEVKELNKTNPAIVVEKALGLYYPFPVYYFVNNRNKKLADRIERGLNLALKDGSFKALFLKYHAGLLAIAELDKRILFKLNNPTLPPNTPKIDTSWWLKEKK